MSVIIFKTVFADSQAIVTFFRISALQLSKLRLTMRKLGQPVLAFVLAAITRWGTHVALLRSVKKAQMAFQEYIRDPTFWDTVTYTTKAFETLNKASKKAE
ncbi:hypothetical protein K470DRAFT_270163 [Piedraia hortae CBS 480.64]|uniref:Uncharacterized protein n=1 Tax=Piedraia hortae CBS 480.64 TaxID=1314780 RepID=A0A6A7C339_9PEZI|nr:hypothetical protein K470DRAFT_270163 [Piedraia hortae CBS 480.64]